MVFFKEIKIKGDRGMYRKCFKCVHIREKDCCPSCLVMPLPHSITARQAWMAPRLRTSLSCWPGPRPVQPDTQSYGTHAGTWKPSTLAPAFGLPAGLLLGPLPSSSSKYSIGQAWKGARCGLLRWLPPFVSFKFYTHTHKHTQL